MINITQEHHIHILEELSYELNAPLVPDSIKPFSDMVVWWKCKRNPNHIWQARVSNRSSGSGCPFCAGNLVYTGETDLETLFPEVAKQWHPTKNGDLDKPSEISAKSNKYAWWQCSRGHEWYTKINNRTSNKTGCPYCSKNRVIKGETDLLSQYPEIAKQWHPVLNGLLFPDEVSTKSNKYAWWICSKGHEWETKIYHRTDGRGCPYCAGLLAIIGETDLSTVNPILAAEWNYSENGDLKPQNVTAHSHKKVWWQCMHGHVWNASVTDRSAGRGCPVCSGRIRIVGVNDFAAIFPDLTREWYHPKNNGKQPCEFAPYSNHYAYWQCEHDQNHIWKTKINNRANGTNDNSNRTLRTD